MASALASPTSVSLASKSAVRFEATKSFLFGGVAGFAGCLVGGVSGSFLMVPMLTSRGLITRLSRPQAHATSLVAVAATGIAGTVILADHVDYEAAATISVCGMMTARAGAMTASRLSPALLRTSLGVFFLSAASIIPLNPYFFGNQKDINNTVMVINSGQSLLTRQRDVASLALATTGSSTEESISQRFFVPAGIGGCSGFIAGLLGVGSGAVVVPALALLTDKDYREILGTSLCALVFPAVTGTVTHFARGTLAMRVAPALAIGASLGGLCGASLAKSSNEDDLKTLFSGWTAVLGVGAWLL
ncbi:sulfite exporter TauE/SafE [Nitzschia inconspicua]|uniref:Sulfite exporter TauE/SafE n=1 Tax=Nitzschia inconspicua TaxID=303405 RepID=A0A9K3LH39_9STRA|nr:sulfite exporter TauE/SafE [Nitzschia inconspicua]